MSPKKRGFNRRRTRRLINDELAFNNEMEDSYENQRSVFENFQYLSQNEKNKIEEKFSKPRNSKQQTYVNELNKRRKYLIQWFDLM